jgi:hypothetical protein
VERYRFFLERTTGAHTAVVTAANGTNVVTATTVVTVTT